MMVKFMKVMILFVRDDFCVFSEIIKEVVKVSVNVKKLGKFLRLEMFYVVILFIKNLNI